MSWTNVREYWLSWVNWWGWTLSPFRRNWNSNSKNLTLTLILTLTLGLLFSVSFLFSLSVRLTFCWTNFSKCGRATWIFKLVAADSVRIEKKRKRKRRRGWKRSKGERRNGRWGRERYRRQRRIDKSEHKEIWQWPSQMRKTIVRLVFLFLLLSLSCP